MYQNTIKYGNRMYLLNNKKHENNFPRLYIVHEK